jgi:hypothetical protein
MPQLKRGFFDLRPNWPLFWAFAVSCFAYYFANNLYVGRGGLGDPGTFGFVAIWVGVSFGIAGQRARSS